MGVFRERGAPVDGFAHFLKEAEGAEAQVGDFEGVVGGLALEDAGGFDEEAGDDLDEALLAAFLVAVAGGADHCKGFFEHAGSEEVECDVDFFDWLVDFERHGDEVDAHEPPEAT